MSLINKKQPIKPTDKINMKGRVLINVYKNGELIERIEQDNLIVNTGKEMVAALLTGTGTYFVDSIGFGENTTTPDPSDTELSGSAFIKYLDSATVDTSSGVNAVFTWSLATTEGNGLTIAEYGLLSGTGGILFSRILRTSTIVKDSTINLTGTWIITF